MRNSRPIPVVTITLALLITMIQILRSLGGIYDEFILTNLDWVNWVVVYDQPWRMLTSPFIHQNLLHYLENLFFLLVFGYQIERTYGWKYFLGAFLGAMVTGHIVWMNIMHNFIWGISGGVCGLFGFSLIANRRVPWWTTLTHRPLHALYFANLIWAVVVDVADWVPYPVAHLNHVVGILYGMAFGAAFLLVTRNSLWRWTVSALPLALFASMFYSPWQIEWRLVKRPPLLVTANADCHLKSIEPDVYTPAHITVMNASTKHIALYWLNYEGKPEYYFRLNPSDSDEYDLFIGHRWCVVDADSREALQAFIVTEPEQTITIR
jgi:membrane associated rhomboid family serine protease